MFKSKTIRVVITFFIFIISIMLINDVSAASVIKFNNEVINWKVTITNDTKDFKNTQELKFNIQNNSNVVKEKIAPGLKANSSLELDLNGTSVPVDIVVTVNNKDLADSMVIKGTIDSEDYVFGTNHTIELENGLSFNEKNGKRIIDLELEWTDSNNEFDTYFGSTKNEISIPITIEVKQHI